MSWREDADSREYRKIWPDLLFHFWNSYEAGKRNRVCGTSYFYGFVVSFEYPPDRVFLRDHVGDSSLHFISPRLKNSCVSQGKASPRSWADICMDHGLTVREYLGPNDKERKTGS